MVLIPTNLNPTSANLRLTTNLLNLGQVKVGQVFSANLQPLNNTQALVTIGSQSFTATLKEPINLTGDVKLVVKQTSPELQLAVQNNKPQTTASNSQALQQSIQNILRQFLPQQSSLNQVVQQLNTLPALPAGINQALQQLLEQLNRPQKINDGKQLQSSILNSGLFMESKLKQGQAKLPGDIKAQMLQLQKQTLQLNQQQPSAALAKLSDLLNQAISRITVQQIQLLENPNVTAYEYLNNQDKINQDTIELHKINYASNTLWEVYINLQLPQGELNSKLSLNDQDSAINCFLWCDNQDVEAHITNKLGALRKQFDDAGLNLNQLQLSPRKLEPKQRKTQVALIDIKV
ncbi:hypothetical protein [Thiomicrorhabdus sediminis]|uniref:Hook-length control protein FliK n=1 Tax=Thiomicrorhabdus sediminis TaxID=2580412 RepID=A0A4P9K846_9GAMM|nr:hypothetical protein [Thiomicrorhabdus sediminis]QCU90427.1 hypothetical protein FE785_07180 [Thiomicrorhabdus sediminis]